MTDKEQARVGATERLDLASRRLYAALEKLHTESFNCWVNGKIVYGDRVPDPKFMMPLHASINEVQYAIKNAWDTFNELDAAARNWSVLNNQPYKLDLVEYYNKASGV